MSDYLSGKSRKTRSCNIFNTMKSVSPDIQTLRKGLKKRGAAEFFNQLRSVWISVETLFRVFDIASQSIHRKHSPNFFDNWDHIFRASSFTLVISFGFSSRIIYELEK